MAVEDRRGEGLLMPTHLRQPHQHQNANEEASEKKSYYDFFEGHQCFLFFVILIFLIAVRPRHPSTRKWPYSSGIVVKGLLYLSWEVISGCRRSPVANPCNGTYLQDIFDASHNSWRTSPQKSHKS